MGVIAVVGEGITVGAGVKVGRTVVGEVDRDGVGHGGTSVGGTVPGLHELMKASNEATPSKVRFLVRYGEPTIDRSLQSLIAGPTALTRTVGRVSGRDCGHLR